MIKQDKHCDALQVLKDAKLNRTPHRLAVLDMLISTDRPLTSTYIFNTMSSRQRVNKVTVYRILSSFMEKDIIRRIPISEGVNYYEMACRHNPVHAHFYCTVCRKMLCLEPLTLSQAWGWLALPDGFKINDLNLTITGVCNHCQGKD